MSADLTPYLDLLPNEHADKPDFLAALAAVLQPFADLSAQLETLITLLDVDTAVGEQLDFIGQWVGVSRTLRVAITGVFFGLDQAGVGFDEGIWLQPYQATTGLLELPDEQYRLVLFVRILNNSWDGSLAAAYTIYDALFANTPYVPFIEDHCDLTISLGLAGAVPDALTMALLKQGYLNVKPAGVTLQDYITPSQTGPIFAFDMTTPYFAGFDSGAWATYTQPA